jgi:hypothetical protein
MPDASWSGQRNSTRASASFRTGTNAIESVNARIRRAVRAADTSQRGRRAQVRLHRRHEPGPDWPRQTPVDHAPKTRPERLRDRFEGRLSAGRK